MRREPQPKKKEQRAYSQSKEKVPRRSARLARHSSPRELGFGAAVVWVKMGLGFRVGLGFKGLGFKGLGFKGLGFKGLGLRV